MKSIKTIQALTEAFGPSGFEGEIKKLIRQSLTGQAEFSQDNLGSLICKKTGTVTTPKIMLPSHMDEIGFMVNSITKTGFIKFIPLGGWWDQVLLAQRVVIKTGSGEIAGIIGSTPPHLMSAQEKEKLVEKKAMFIDIGANSKQEAIEMGVQPGDPIVPYSHFQRLGHKLFMNKALDNRAGCALVIDIIKALQTIAHPNTVYGVGTVQEEVGLRGATTAAHVIAPDICLTIDVTIATDTPGLEKEDPEIKLGDGPVLTLADASAISNRNLRNLVIEIAQKYQIPLQFNTMMGGGTDAGAVSKSGSGVPSVMLSLPTRYIHSHYSVLHYDDYHHTLQLLLKLIEHLDIHRVEEIKNFES